MTIILAQSRVYDCHFTPHSRMVQKGAFWSAAHTWLSEQVSGQRCMHRQCSEGSLTATRTLLEARHCSCLKSTIVSTHTKCKSLLRCLAPCCFLWPKHQHTLSTYTWIPLLISQDTDYKPYNQTQTVHNPAMTVIPNNPIHRDGSPLPPPLAPLIDSVAYVMLYPSIRPPVCTSTAEHT
jgi:hypothetical protein